MTALGCALLAAELAGLPATGHSQDCTPVPPGLVAWWKGDNTAANIVGGANGTLVGNAGYAAGRVGGAFTFDGSGDAVSLGNPMALQLQNFTIEAWIKRASSGPASGNILSYGSGAYGFAIVGEGTLILAKIWVVAVSSSVRVTDTSWHHVAVTKSGSTVVFYVDGTAYPAPAFNPEFEFGDNVQIGARNNEDSFNGLIDEVSVYNRGLSVAEVAAIYAAGSGGKCLIAQPESRMAYEGSTVSLGVVSLAQPASTYQWRKAGSNLVNGGRVSGVTTTNLTLAGVQLSDAGDYTVVISSASGSVASSVAILQVLPTNAPSVQINGRLAVGVVSATSPAALTITGGFSGGFIFYTLDGSTPSVGAPLYEGPLVLSSNAVIQAMSLSADFSHSAFAPAVTFQIIPTYPLQTSVSGDGTISASPSSGPYPSNSVVTLTATAGVGWTFDRWTGSLSGSANPAALTMNGNKTVQAVFTRSAYPLTVSSPGGGSVTGNGGAVAPGTYYPTGSVVALQATASSGWSFLRWEGTASGSANPLSVTINQTNNIQAIFATVLGTTVAGSGSITLNPPNPVPYGTVVTVTAVPMPGKAFVVWSGALSGSANPAILTVISAPLAIGALFTGPTTATIVTQPTNTAVLPGGSATFSVTASGAPPLSYQWWKAGSPLTGATDSSFTIASAAAADAGGYSVVVGNAYGSPATSSVATLTVLIPVAITGQPLTQVVAAGETATFRVTAIGSPAPAYQWLFQGTNLAGATASSLVLTNVGTNALGPYHAAVWNAYSAATSAPALLLMSPSIRGAFVGATVTWGKPASISVSAIGSAPLSYQWYKDGAPVAGATRATLDFPTVQLTDAGMYSVVISSPYGSTTNAPAQVVVNPANMWLGMYAGVTIEGVPGYTYTIQYSTDLRDTNSWVTVTNLTLVEPIELWVDRSVNVYGGQSLKRYYRVVAY